MVNGVNTFLPVWTLNVFQAMCDWELFIFVSLPRVRGGGDLCALITCCQDYLTWVIVTQSSSWGWRQEGRKREKTMTKRKNRVKNPGVISQMKSKSCEALISIILISTHDWLSELVSWQSLIGLDPRVFLVTQSTQRGKITASCGVFP